MIDTTDLEVVEGTALSLSCPVSEQMMLAHKYPRNVGRFADSLVSMATSSQEVAEACVYALKKGGDVIRGPSVRLAEMAASAWGNSRCGSRIVGLTADGRHIVSEGFFYDLETNVMTVLQCQRSVSRSQRAGGGQYSVEMIAVTGNAAAAIAYRNAVLKAIPLALIQKAYQAALETASGGKTTLAERRAAVIGRLQALNPDITESRILGAIDRQSTEEVTWGDIETLIGYGTAIREGAGDIDEIFPIVEPSLASLPSAVVTTTE